KPGRPGGNASWLSGGVAGYTMPDFTIVARRLANSSATNLPNAGPVSTAGVQPFFSSDSAQDLVLSAARIMSVRALRWASLMPGAPYTPRQLPISTLMPCSFKVGTLIPFSRVPDVTAIGFILPAV